MSCQLTGASASLPIKLKAKYLRQQGGGWRKRWRGGRCPRDDAREGGCGGSGGGGG